MPPAVRPDLNVAKQFLQSLREITSDPPGVTRASYGPGEHAAHELMAATGAALGLEVGHDAPGNTYVTLPGSDRAAKRIIIGSHLDSVPHGGNFDGAAGVAAGLAVVSGFLRSGRVPPQDVAVMGIRAEEGCWFPATWLGSRMALGSLDTAMLDSLRRSDTGRTLAEHLAASGFDPQAVRSGLPHLSAANVACFIEAHIEQGPVLAAEGLPLGVVELIMAGPRFRAASIRGTEAHAGGAPRAFRHDAVAALGDVIAGVSALWRKLEVQGRHTVFTFGIVQTDPARHAFSRVPGEVSFCLDSRATDEATVRVIFEEIRSLLRSVEKTHGVSIDMGPDSGPAIGPMDAGLVDRLDSIATHLGIPHRRMPSGAGHDAGAFIEAGVPCGMLFIRNEQGSHNPDEWMALDDLEQACQVIMSLLSGE